MPPTPRLLVRRSIEAFRRVTDPRYQEFEQQRLISDRATREAFAHALAKRLPRSGNAAPPSAEKLATDGYTMLPDLVSSSQVADIRNFFADKMARDIRRPERKSFRAPEAIPTDAAFAEYSDADIVNAPHLLDIANHPKVLGLVESVLGVTPVIGAMRVWWSSPTPGGPVKTELFHRDVDDLRFVKLFVYLTDVDDSSGPHIYAAGSHRKDVLTEIRRYSDEEVYEAIAEDTLVRFTGGAGTSFLENTYGLHRGLPPVSSPRLVFQPLYTMRPVIYGPRRPLRQLRPPERHLDRRINGVYLRS